MYMKLINISDYSFTVADAWGKLPSGILSGNIIELGNYDQCLKIREQMENDDLFQGQYCFSLVRTVFNTSTNSSFGAFPFQEQQPDVTPINTRFLPAGPTAGGSGPGLAMGFGICGPATCSEELLLSLVEMAFKQVNIKNVTVEMIPYTCQKDEPYQFRSEDIAVL